MWKWKKGLVVVPEGSRGNMIRTHCTHVWNCWRIKKQKHKQKNKQVYVLVVSIPFNGAISTVLKILFKKKKSQCDPGQESIPSDYKRCHVSPPDNMTHVTDLVLFSPRQWTLILVAELKKQRSNCTFLISHHRRNLKTCLKHTGVPITFTTFSTHK